MPCHPISSGHVLMIVIIISLRLPVKAPCRQRGKGLYSDRCTIGACESLPVTCCGSESLWYRCNRPLASF
eukprot:1188544-Prorocentrum_minimum.AAC.3